MKRKLTFREKLYLGEGIEEKKLDKLKRKLRNKPFLTNVYLIVPASNPVDQLDIFKSNQLAWPYYEKQSFYIIGMASGYQEALTLIEQMAGECMAQRGDCKLREFLVGGHESSLC